MASFKKKTYTDPVISRHDNDLAKDWYVFFRYKYAGNVYKFKRREGINKIKDLQERLSAVEDLKYELKFDLKNGWNPLDDPKRELDYLLPTSKDHFRSTKNQAKIIIKREIQLRLLNEKGK